MQWAHAVGLCLLGRDVFTIRRGERSKNFRPPEVFGCLEHCGTEAAGQQLKAWLYGVEGNGLIGAYLGPYQA